MTRLAHHVRSGWGIVRETCTWIRLSHKRCVHTAVPMTDGTVCPHCGQFTPWNEGDR